MEEDSPIVAPSRIFFTYTDFIFPFYLPVLKVLCV